MMSNRTPALFIGHGTPMNAIEVNKYTKKWRQLGETLPRPKAIVMISAHWYTRKAAVTAMEKPKTIHDFGGFPQALYDVQYPAAGSPALAQQVIELLSPIKVDLDQSWGLDHGAWSVLVKMYPKADIPVLQLSIDASKPAAYHFEMGRKLAPLREQGIMIIGSGNVVHNLRMLKHNDDPYPWAKSFNQYVRSNLGWQGPVDQHPLVNFKQHEAAALANPSPEHYLPLLYVLGCRAQDEPHSILTEGYESGSLSMLSAQFG